MLRDPSAFSDLNDLIYDVAKSVPGVECIVGLDSRGFLFGPILAQKLNIPFVPVRKKGKLPGDVERISFSLEYGSVSTQFRTIDTFDVNLELKIVNYLLYSRHEYSVLLDFAFCLFCLPFLFLAFWAKFNRLPKRDITSLRPRSD